MNLLLKLFSSPWFWADVLLSITGGIIVYWGLSIEKRAERRMPPADFKKDIFDDVIEVEKSELERGWRILMLGIIIEVVAALGISVISSLEIAELNDKAEQAGKDAAAAKLEASQANERASTNELQVALLSNETVRLSINLEEAKSNGFVLQKQIIDLQPENQPIRSFSAILELWFSPTDLRLDRFPLYSSEMVSTVDKKGFAGILDAHIDTGGGPLSAGCNFRLAADKLEIIPLPSLDDRIEVSAKFHLLPKANVNENPEYIFRNKVEFIEDIQQIHLQVFIKYFSSEGANRMSGKTNVDILAHGTLTFLVNDPLYRKEISIPWQKSVTNILITIPSRTNRPAVKQ